MNIKRISGIVLRQFYLMRGSPSRVVPLFLWVAIDIILWGYITKYLNTISSVMNFVPAVLGAVLLWNFFTRVMHGVTMAFFEDVWSRNFINIFAAPIAISEYLAGLIISGLITSLFGLIGMLLISSLIFGFNFFMYGILILPFLFILLLFGIALGIFGSAIVLKYGPAAEWFVWPIPALISPFVGVFYPTSTLPIWMQSIAKLLPPAYIFETIRNIINQQNYSYMNFVISFMLAIIYLVLASCFFNRTYKQAVRTGLIAKYSAESIS